MNEKKEYLLDGLCCANCAAKIEKEVGDLAEVGEANINLMNNKLSISLGVNNSEGLTDKIIKIVASHEPTVKVVEVSETTRNEQSAKKKEKAEERKNILKVYLLRLGLAVGLSILVSLIKMPESVRLVGYLIAYALAGYETLITAVKNIIKGKLFDENFLMGFASLGAFIIGERVEAIAVLVFYGVGELLQDMAVDKSKRDIVGLMDIRPDYANKLEGDNITVVAPERIEVGERILVKPGEKIPLDGIIVKGNSFIDTRALTGESVPVEVTVEDTVLSGTINVSGVIEVEVTTPFFEATVTKILEMVQNAGSKKAESEKFITRFARYCTPIVVFTAVAVAIFPPMFGFGSFTLWLYRALSFLIISCPCALVISIPMSFFGGIGGGAKQGVLVKGGNYLDALKQVDTVVFDKTGTLTQGVFKVSGIYPTTGVESSDLILMAAIAENHSTHPIAKSILNHYYKENSKMSNKQNNNESIDESNNANNKESIPAAQITEIAGHGVVAEYNSDLIYAGNEKLMKKYEISYISPENSGSVVHVALGRKYLGYILISDEIKPGAREAIVALKQLGVRKTVMLTGDHKNSAKEIAEQCQIDEYQAELLPQDKVSWFEDYKKKASEKGKIIFVGDGINDAPVLAGADIGIAMGGIGSDAAIEAADVVIMNDEIYKIVTAIKIARKTHQIVMQNIVFALGTKVLIMILSFLGITSIWFAIFADVGVALIALANAMRAMYLK